MASIRNRIENAEQAADNIAVLNKVHPKTPKILEQMSTWGRLLGQFAEQAEEKLRAEHKRDCLL